MSTKTIPAIPAPKFLVRVAVPAWTEKQAERIKLNLQQLSAESTATIEDTENAPSAVSTKEFSQQLLEAEARYNELRAKYDARGLELEKIGRERNLAVAAAQETGAEFTEEIPATVAPAKIGDWAKDKNSDTIVQVIDQNAGRLNVMPTAGGDWWVTFEQFAEHYEIITAAQAEKLSTRKTAAAETPAPSAQSTESTAPGQTVTLPAGVYETPGIELAPNDKIEGAPVVKSPATVAPSKPHARSHTPRKPRPSRAKKK